MLHNKQQMSHLHSNSIVVDRYTIRYVYSTYTIYTSLFY